MRLVKMLCILVVSGTAFSGAGFAQKQGREDLAAPAGGENAELIQLRQRVEQLEEQLVDMQVTMGTVESLGRKNRSGARAGTIGAGAPNWSGPMQSDLSPNAGGDGRIQVLETQIGALTQQVEQLTRRLGGSGHQAQSNDFGFRGNDGGARPGANLQGFGNVTVMPGEQVRPQSFNNARPDVGPRPFAAQNANFDNRPPQKIYDEAYRHLMVQDYGAAEAAFTTFLQQHSNDKLAGNAQYWLGESYYVRGQYKNAAGAFLKGYKVYDKSQKAPDSLLKLAMSLKRLGQKDAACDTFGELGTRFPRAPSHIKQRAQSERRRSGC